MVVVTNKIVPFSSLATVAKIEYALEELTGGIPGKEGVVV
jgi:hypothetical protein